MQDDKKSILALFYISLLLFKLSAFHVYHHQFAEKQTSCTHHNHKHVHHKNHHHDDHNQDKDNNGCEDCEDALQLLVVEFLVSIENELVSNTNWVEFLISPNNCKVLPSL